MTGAPSLVRRAGVAGWRGRRRCDRRCLLLRRRWRRLRPRVAELSTTRFDTVLICVQTSQSLKKCRLVETTVQRYPFPHNKPVSVILWNGKSDCICIPAEYRRCGGPRPLHAHRALRRRSLPLPLSRRRTRECRTSASENHILAKFLTKKIHAYLKNEFGYHPESKGMSLISSAFQWYSHPQSKCLPRIKWRAMSEWVD